MSDTLEVLNGSGHLTLTWNPEDPADVERARETVNHLKSQGYSFFVVAGSVGDDAVEQGAGRIIVDRIEDPTAPPLTVAPAAALLPNAAVLEIQETPKATPSKGKGRRHVAVRPMAGG